MLIKIIIKVHIKFRCHYTSHSTWLSDEMIQFFSLLVTHIGLNIVIVNVYVILAFILEMFGKNDVMHVALLR